MENNVIAIVVTYNRKILLAECLNAILSQTVKPKKVLVINNASTDGTELLFSEDGEFSDTIVECITLSENTGGSGGFYEGMKRAQQEVCDWVWVMDDDTIPQSDCLEKLLEADAYVSNQPAFLEGNRQTSFYASTVFGEAGEFMNVPNINTKPSSNGYPFFYEFLEKSLINIGDATFVSLLIRKKAIDSVGLPCKDYFIWGDDGEYTLRLTHYYGDAYMVGNSIVVHKRVGAKSLSIDNFDDPKRIKMYHYYVRNNIINSLFYHKDRNQLVTVTKKIMQSFFSLKYLFRKNGIVKISAITKGTLEGFLQYKAFKKYIQGQIKK